MSTTYSYHNSTTPDDALEPRDDIYNPRSDEETLPEDNDSPATPAAQDPSDMQIPPDHPVFDSDIDSHEAYDASDVSATDVEALKQRAHEDEPEPMEWDETA